VIPHFDLSLQHHALREELDAAMRSVMDSGRFVLGPEVRAFEAEAADYLGCRHAIGCASGTDALRLSLHALGIGPGDEVITTPFSFIAAVEAIVLTGARPVFADVDPLSFTLDPKRVEAAVTRATRAILPVHLYGRPAAMDALLDIARRHRLHVVEDCAQSFGARHRGRATGTLGIAGCFSFYPTKNLGGCGDGGMVSTDCDALAARLRELRNHGGSDRHRHRRIGHNSRLDELQAAILRVKLRRVDAFNAARRDLARRYRDGLRDVPGLRLPEEHPADRHVFHQYTVLASERAALCASLDAAGIGYAIHYPQPLHRQPAIAALAVAPMPVAEDLARHCLCLPMFPELSPAQADRVVAAVVESAAGLRKAEP
jgi:dTDP-4-amino-4,6-dideoxygalactose transaminase